MLSKDGQWGLYYAGTEYAFGAPDDEVFNVTTPDLGDYEVLTDDAVRPREDGVNFGTDYHGGRLVSFDLASRRHSEDDVRSSIARLALAWRADAVRRVPGAVAELRMRYRGRERVVFGRPRRFAPNLKDAATVRYATAVADFQAADSSFYSAETFEASVSMAPPLGGGLMAPLAAPLSTTASSDRSTVVRVGGELPAWPVIEIPGPVTNPGVEVIGLWRMDFPTTVAYDETLVVDTRPWVRTSQVAGRNVQPTRTSARLSKAGLVPGTYELAIRGASQTQTPTARISWRETYSTP